MINDEETFCRNPLMDNREITLETVTRAKFAFFEMASSTRLAGVSPNQKSPSTRELRIGFVPCLFES